MEQELSYETKNKIIKLRTYLKEYWPSEYKKYAAKKLRQAKELKVEKKGTTARASQPIDQQLQVVKKK